MSEDLDPITPEGALDYYLDARQYDLADDTYSTHEYRLESFVRWLQSPDHGDGEILNMNEVDLRTIHAFRVFKREENFEDIEPCNAVTMQGQVSTLRKFLEYVAEIDAVPGDLAEKVRLPKFHPGEDVDEETLEAERANAILEHLHLWEYATPQHVAFLLIWRTSARLGGVRSLDVEDVDLDDGALCFRHRPGKGTPLKNNVSSERDVSINHSVEQVLEDYLESPHLHDVTDEYDRRPLLTTRQGRPDTSTIRDWIYRWTQPCQIGEGCPGDREPEACDATESNQVHACPYNVSPHPVRSGSITALRDAGTSRLVVSDRGDVSEKILEKHYDRASKRQRMHRRRDQIPDQI